MRWRSGAINEVNTELRVIYARMVTDLLQAGNRMLDKRCCIWWELEDICTNILTQ